MSAGFGKGNVGFVVLGSPSGLPEDWMERMGAQGLPSIGQLEEESIHGWCGCRHAQDRVFTDESLLCGSYPTGLLVQAERKIPASTLAAEIALEEMAVMQAEDKAYLNQQTRSEIKKSIQERLLPDMPVVFKGVEWVYVETGNLKLETGKGGGLVFCTATSEKALDSFVLMWMQTFGVALERLDPSGLALGLGHDALDWPPVAFGQQGELFCDGAGREFLMWLWYTSERRGGLVNVPGAGEFAYMLDGTLVLEGDNKTVTVKSSLSVMDSETVAALVDGLTLRKCRLQLVRGEEVWTCKLDADDLVFRGMKLPPTESFDREGKFAERIALLGVFWSAFSHLFSLYCEERSDAGWKDTVRLINDWIVEKGTRHQALGTRDLTTAGDVEVSIGTNVLKGLTRAADLAGKLYERREELQGIMHGTYQEKVEPYMKLVRAEMKLSEVNCLKAALQLGKDMEVADADAVQISLQLVAGLEVHEADSTTKDTKHTKKDRKGGEKKSAPDTAEPKTEDDLLVEQAIGIIKKTNRASTSSLQRRMKIGYTRAARVMDMLEERGIIGPPVGAGPREILLSTDSSD